MVFVMIAFLVHQSFKGCSDRDCP